MGTINFRTSDYITLGPHPYDVRDFEADKPSIIENMLENGYRNITDNEFYEYVYRLIHDYYDDDCYNAKGVLEDYRFHYFDIEIDYGYYEGFSINIDYNYKGDNFSDIEEKREAKEETDKVKECLVNLAGIGLRACYPFWYTEYEDYDATLAKINEAVEEMKEDVRMTDICRYAWEV